MINEFKQVINHGGVTLISIVVLSVLVVFVTIERLLHFYQLEQRIKTLTDQLVKLVYQKNLEQAKVQCQQSLKHSQMAHAYLICLLRHINQKPNLIESFQRERLIFLQSLKKRMWILGTTATAAPFVGLFGTVVGIMRSFQDIANEGGGGFAVVSQGLSEALITTAAGILVAVEAVVFYNYLQTKLQHISFVFKISGEEFLDSIQDSNH